MLHILSVSYRNVSAALSLINKVYNYIYSTHQQLTLYVHDYETGAPRKEQIGYWSLTSQVYCHCRIFSDALRQCRLKVLFNGNRKPVRRQHSRADR